MTLNFNGGIEYSVTVTAQLCEGNITSRSSNPLILNFQGMYNLLLGSIVPITYYSYSVTPTPTDIDSVTPTPTDIDEADKSMYSQVPQHIQCSRLKIMCCKTSKVCYTQDRLSIHTGNIRDPASIESNRVLQVHY